MQMTTPGVLAYLKADRQWFRAHRIAHARLELRHARITMPDAEQFWLAVLEALGDGPLPKKRELTRVDPGTGRVKPLEERDWHVG